MFINFVNFQCNFWEEYTIKQIKDETLEKSIKKSAKCQIWKK